VGVDSGDDDDDGDADEAPVIVVAAATIARPPATVALATILGFFSSINVAGP